MRILAIETSCDETSMALVDCKGTLRQAQGSKLRFKVLQNIVLSQIKVHRPFGGVVPNLAKREHIKNLPIVLKKIFEVRDDRDDRNARNARNDKRSDRSTRSPIVDLIAVTVGPGLEPALWAGIEFAKKLSKEIKKPLMGVNHMEGHLYSNVLKNIRITFPAVALVASGGHTILLHMTSLTKWKKLGETRDDAAGEAFDKVARMLNLPYPGGPEIQKLAAKGNPVVINFPRPMLKDKNYDFSFSGLKTAVLYYLRDFGSEADISSPKLPQRSSMDFRYLNTESRARGQKQASRRTSAAGEGRDSAELMANVAASFQQAVIDVLVGKTIRAAKEFGAKSVLLCGGVAANKKLRKDLGFKIKNLGLKFFVPSFEFNTDNAAMIAAAAYIQKLRKKKLAIKAQSNLTL